jgi:hypothetical protein
MSAPTAARTDASESRIDPAQIDREWIGAAPRTLANPTVWSFLAVPPRDRDDRLRLRPAGASGRAAARARRVPRLHGAPRGQNYHLVHHLWTTIPWYRYQRIFFTIDDALAARGCRIGWNTELKLPNVA